jgi:broad specificity phosphatase PhoE
MADTATIDTPPVTAPPAPGPQTPPPADPPVKKLYDKLNSDGFYTKSYDDFQKQFSTPDAIDKLYGKLNEGGQYTKDKDAFYQRFFPTAKPLPGENQFQYQPEQQNPIPQANTPQFGLTPQEQHANAVYQADQDMPKYRAQYGEQAINNMAHGAMQKEIQYKVGQALDLYAKPSSTSAKAPASAAAVQFPSDQSNTNPATTGLPEVVNPIVDKYMDPETGYGAAMKINEANDPTGGTTKNILHQIIKDNPAAAPQIQNSAYLSESRGRGENASKILENSAAIQKGDLQYDVRSGQLMKPEGFFPSLAHAFEKRNQDMADAGVYMNGSRQDILNKLESVYAAHDPDKPVGVPDGWLARQGATMGDQGPVTLNGVLWGAAGTIGGGLVGNPELGPVLAAAVTTPEFMARSYKNSLESNFIKAREGGASADQALDAAQPTATRTAALDGAQAAAMSVVGSKLGFSETPEAAGVASEASPTYLSAATKLLKKVPTFAKDVGIEAGTMGGIGAAVQGLKNINEGKPIEEGTGDAFWGTAAFTGVMGAISKGLGTVVNSAKDFNALKRGAAKAPQPVIDAALGDLLTTGQASPEEVIQTREALKDQKAADAALPELDEATQQKVQNLIDQRDKQQKLMDDPSNAKYKTEFKGSIDALNEQIEGLKGQPKPDELIQKAQGIIAQDKIPGAAGTIIKEASADPEALQGHLKEIAEQSYDPGTTASTRKAYDGLVDIAQEMYPIESLPHVENMHSLTVEDAAKENHEPVSPTIEPDKAFRTIDYGDYADGNTPETPMAKASVAKDIEAGDVKIGNTGETFNEFKPRVIEPFQKALETEAPNTAIVTSSSVLKALSVWDDMGRPDINSLTPEQTKEFADKYNEETVDPGELVSFDKVKGDPSQGQIHVIRHGETDANEMGTFRTDDSNLTQGGINDAQNAGAKLKDLLDGAQPPKIIASDLPRTIHTANEVYKVAADIQRDPRAVEVSDETHPVQAHEALQGSYDRLVEGGADPKDPDMVKLKDQIDNIKNKSYAIQKQTAAQMDVRQQAEDGQTVGGGDTQYQQPAAAGGEPNEQRPDTGNPSTEPTGTEGKDKAPDEEKGTAGTSTDDQVKATLEKAPNPVTGIRNVITEQRIKEMGLEPFEQQAAREWGPVWDKAKEKINNGYDIQGLIDRKEKNPGEGLTDEEAALLTLHRVRKESEYENAMNDIIRASREQDPKKMEEARITMASTKDALQQLGDVTKETGREAARGFNARKMLSDRRYTLANMVLEKQAAKDGEPLTPEEEATVKQQFEDIKAKNVAYEKRIADLEEENKQLKADQAVKDAQKSKPKTPKTHDDYVADRQKILDDIREKLKKSRGEAGATVVPYAKELFTIAPDVLKLVKSLVEEGIDKLPDLITHVHDTLKDSIDGLTKKDVRDLIAGEYNQPAKDLSPDQVKLRDLRMQATLINKLETLQAGEEKAAGKEPVEYSQEVKDLRQQIKDFQKEQKPPKQGRTPLSEESRLNSYKTRLNKQIADLQKRVRDSDFAAKAAPAPIALDKDARYLKAELVRAQDAYQLALKKDQLKNRSTFEKLLGGFVKVERAEKLSSPLTIGKLMSAALTRLAITPVEEAVGGAITPLLSKSFKQKALGEVGFNGKALATGYREAITSGMKDSWMNLKNQRSDLEAVFGKQGELPSTAIDYLGQLHAATKAPVKRFFFERSLQKRLENAIKYDIKISDPLVMSNMLNSAYKDANRAIFMQDNMVSDFYTKGVSNLEKNTNYPVGGKVVAAAARWMVPFVKIPSNIIGEVGSLAGGHVYAGVRAAIIAMDKGMSNATPEEAEMILRNLKKGTIGAGALLLGYFNPENFGGFYQKGQQKKEDEPGWMGARIFGQNIPGWMMESPIFQAMNLGATVRKLSDTYVKKDKTTQGVWSGSGHALLGLAEEEPLVEQPSQVFNAITNERDRMYYLGELAKSTIDPAILNNIATWTDPADQRSFMDQLAKSETIRKPTTIGQHIEMGIPGLRENVPLKKGVRSNNPPNNQ